MGKAKDAALIIEKAMQFIDAEPGLLDLKESLAASIAKDAVACNQAVLLILAHNTIVKAAEREDERESATEWTKDEPPETLH